jgi:site-specific recombinase XerC
MPSAILTLDRHQLVWWLPTDPVFTDAAGERIDTTKLATRLRALLSQAGLSSDLRFHDLRHSAATLWLAAGVDIKATADLMAEPRPGSATQGRVTILGIIDLSIHSHGHGHNGLGG